jgi:acyl-CoA thioester hydrolase
MEKIKMEIPSQFIFNTVYNITISDINYGGHLGNEKVLSIAHEARIRFLKSLGYTEFDIEGTGIIMINAVVEYKSEGFLGDEIRVDVGMDHFTSSGFDMFYKMLNQTTGKTLAIVKTGILCFDYEKRKIRKLPKAFVENIDNLNHSV